jgi:3D (Asp-Asp-Asp) domain-containing protein/peptidoglycan hydrolase CwlO-like protein
MKSLNKKFFKNTAIILLLFIISSGFAFFTPKNIWAITLQELSSQIAALSGEEEALVEEIIMVEATIDNTKNEIANLDVKISTIEDELEQLNTERNVLQKSIGEKRELLEERIVYTYKYSKNHVVKMILTARDINEFISVVYLMKNILAQDAALIESIRLDKESYDRIMRKSEEKKRELEQTRSEKKTEQEKLEANLEKNEFLLEKVKNEKSSVAGVLSAIRERISRIQPEGVTLTGEWSMVATAYYAGGGGLNGNGITATGLRARKGLVAVDPKVIRLGTKLYIEGYGIAIAADTGGWIKENRIDLCFDTLEECYRFGRRKIYVYLAE